MKISEMITDRYKLRIPPTIYYELLADVQELEEEEEPITKNDLVTIHTEGLDEEIRCTMCTNYMKSDRGCDGSCVVDKDMYKAVMDAIEKRIQPTTKKDLGVDAVSRQAVIDLMMQKWGENFSGDDAMQESIDAIRVMPSVTSQNQVNLLCEDCHTKMDEVRRAYDNAMKQEPIFDKLRAEITTLQNRCYALTKGTMCAFCRYECEYKAETEAADDK